MRHRTSTFVIRLVGGGLVLALARAAAAGDVTGFKVDEVSCFSAPSASAAHHPISAAEQRFPLPIREERGPYVRIDASGGPCWVRKARVEIAGSAGSVEVDPCLLSFKGGDQRGVRAAGECAR